jgi:hypothetical protein
MVEWQMSFLHEKIAVGEHHRQRHIFVSGGDEQFVRDK